MRISGTIVDAQTGEPLPSASVYITDGATALGAGTIANSKGQFVLDSSHLDSPMNMVVIDYAGYQPQQLISSENFSTIKLQRDADAPGSESVLDEVVVTFKKIKAAAKKKNPLVWWIVGAGTLGVGIFLYFKFKK